MGVAQVLSAAMSRELYLEEPVRLTVRADEVVWSDRLAADPDAYCWESMPLSGAAVGFVSGWSLGWSKGPKDKWFDCVERDELVEVLRIRRVV